jgi:sugar phosphate isomerase/epimerase
MYWNLCPETLGVTGRQSELIELALTYGFAGIDLDMQHFCKQAELRGLEHASRFLRSARLNIGAFDLPVRWQGDEDELEADLKRLPSVLEATSSLGAKTCYTTIQPASDTLPYHENFEFHRERLSRVAEALVPHDVRLGMALVAPTVHRQSHSYQFISTPEALLTLMKTTVVSNLAILVDLWQWRIGGGTIDQLRELSPEQVVMVRLSDIPDDVSFESATEQNRLIPGKTGIVDSVGALKVLEEIGYDGPVTPYPDPTHLKGQTRDRIVQQAADSLEALWKAAEMEKPTGHLAPVSGGNQ